MINDLLPQGFICDGGMVGGEWGPDISPACHSLLALPPLEFICVHVGGQLNWTMQIKYGGAFPSPC